MVLGLRWRWLRPFKLLGDISYPLYLVHIPFAWISLAFLASHGVGMLGAGLITGAMVFAVAWLMHVLVEKPIQIWARSVTRGHALERNWAGASGR